MMMSAITGYSYRAMIMEQPTYMYIRFVNGVLRSEPGKRKQTLKYEFFNQGVLRLQLVDL